MKPAIIQSIYDLQHEYTEFVEKIKTSGGFDLAKWLPKFRDSVRPMFPGELIVVMADTGVGKTAIIQNICKAARGYGDVLLFELELPGTLCFERFAALSADMSQGDVFQRYSDANKVNVGSVDHIYTCDKAGMTLDEMTNLIVEANAEGQQFDVIMVDYIGLMKASQGMSRYERMSEMAEQMKVFARDMNAVVVVSTQIHRKGEDYVDNVGLHDAKDSGSIENSADLLIGAWRDLDEPQKLYLKILKNRKGKGGDTIEARFDGGRMRITPWYMVPEAMGDAWEPGD